MNLAQVILNGILIGGVYALVAVGLTLIFGIMDVVNFAHGSFVMIAMYVAFFAWSLLGVDPLIAVPICALVLGILGYVTYQLIIRKASLSPAAYAPIVATFGLLVLLPGVAQSLWTANPRTVGNRWSSSLDFTTGRLVVSGPLLIAFLVAIAVTVLLAQFLNHTKIGNALVATGQDKAAASLMGINIRRMNALAWAIGIGCAGIAGALVANIFTITPSAGTTFGVIAFIAVALGGFGSVIGAGLAGILLGIIQGIVSLYFPLYDLAAIGALFLLVVLVRPQGLMGRQ